jgi:hypothetical protein
VSGDWLTLLHAEQAEDAEFFNAEIAGIAEAIRADALRASMNGFFIPESCLPLA